MKVSMDRRKALSEHRRGKGGNEVIREVVDENIGVKV